MFENVNFIIGGDGDKMILLKMLIEKYNLYERVELLGSLKHSEVRDVLNRGHIFLNTSLTESFCIAILEAASCGLFVVTTKVGGVPEVLPTHMVYTAEPEENDLLKKLYKAIKHYNKIDTSNYHEELKKIYSWSSVAERTELTYNQIVENEVLNTLGRLKVSAVCAPFLILIVYSY